MKPTTVAGVVVGFILCLVAVVFAVRQFAPTPVRSVSTATTSASVPISTDIDSATLASSDTESTTTGVATRAFIDSVFVHGITAFLPDLPTGQTYAGWLSTDNSVNNALATGTLAKQGDSYMLNYSAPTDYRTYNYVFITVQTAPSQLPQTTVLSGMFQSK